MTHTASRDLKRPGPLLLLTLFVVGVVAIGSAIGSQTAPGAWYEALDKPVFNPPNWVFAPVWTVLYVMIGIAGWRVFMAAPKSPAMVAWAAQMVLNWAWSPVFFTAQNLWLALVVIIAMLALIVAFIVLNWRRDRLASLLFLAYAAWVGFATILNLSIAVMN